MTTRSVLPTAAVAALVAVGAAVAMTTPATAAQRPSDRPHWASASSAAGGLARTAAVREAARSAVEASGRSGSAEEYDFFRIAGSSRYATSVAASKALYTDEVIADHPVGPVFVASGTNFPDALAATALVKPFGPLLLVPSSGTVPAVVAAELRRLDPEDVVVGGAAAVSGGVASQLARIAPVSRIAGADRYDTAARIAPIVDEGWGPDSVHTVYVVNGDSFADALAAGPGTGYAAGAVLLTRTGSLPATSAGVLQDLAPARVVVVGGTGVVSAAVVSRIKSLVPGAQVVRRAGADRYATAAVFSVGEYVHPGAGAVLANGLTFPDALTAAAFGAVVDYPLLLAKAACSPDETVDEARSYADQLEPPFEVVGFGGTTVLSDRALTLTRC